MPRKARGRREARPSHSPASSLGSRNDSLAAGAKSSGTRRSRAQRRASDHPSAVTPPARGAGREAADRAPRAGVRPGLFALLMAGRVYGRGGRGFSTGFEGARAIARQPAGEVDGPPELAAEVAQGSPPRLAVHGVDLAAGEKDGADEDLDHTGGGRTVARLGAEEPQPEGALIGRVEPSGEEVAQEERLGGRRLPPAGEVLPRRQGRREMAGRRDLDPGDVDGDKGRGPLGEGGAG